MQALILAGGSGTRFWPLSRRSQPKQLLALEGERSLLQATIDRLSPLIEPADVWVCTTEALADAVREQLPEVPAAQVLSEPTGRNTAPAIGWSLRSMPTRLTEGVVAVLPADHRFAEPEAFRQVLAAAAERAASDDLVLALGVEPRWAETGYGYLELGDAIEASRPGSPDDGCRQVVRFREKPDAATAASYAASGKHLWNAGIFVFRGTTLLDRLAEFEPQLAAGLEQIAGQPERTAELYPQLKSISIDYAVMERLDAIASLPLDCGWSDLGSWQALAEIMPADDDGNTSRGDVIAIDARDNLLVADQGTIAVVGIDNLVVVRTADSVLVIPRERSQDVRAIVDQLRQQQRSDRL